MHADGLEPAVNPLLHRRGQDPRSGTVALPGVGELRRRTLDVRSVALVAGLSVAPAD